MEIIKVKDLKPHPRNKEFFDDIVGEQWEDFKESIKQSGIIEPIVITTNMMVVSGHQRIRACNELGITEILARIKPYSKDEVRNVNEEDVVLEELIFANIKNRAVPNNNAVKFGRCLKFLEMVNGVRQGSIYIKPEVNEYPQKTREDLSNEIGISQSTWKNYTKLTTLIPEIQNLIQDDKISPDVARKIFSKLDENDQKKVFDIYTPNKLSEAKTSNVKEIIKEIERIVEVYPDDYENFIHIKNKVEVLEKRESELQQRLKQQTSSIQSMKSNDDRLSKAEVKRKRLEEEMKNVEIKKHKLEKDIFESENKLQKIDKLYGDATNTLEKQLQLNELLDKHKDLMKLMESKFIGFKPHRMGEDNFKAIIQEYKECLYSSIKFIDNLEETSNYIEAEEIENV